MKTTIDRAGRLVIPKQLRDEIGMEAGEVEVSRDGAAIKVEPLPGSELVEESGLLMIPRSGTPLDDDRVRSLRDADRR